MVPPLLFYLWMHALLTPIHREAATERFVLLHTLAWRYVVAGVAAQRPTHPRLARLYRQRAAGDCVHECMRQPQVSARDA